MARPSIPENRAGPATHPLPPDVGCITDIAGVRIGHAQSDEGHTGCTVVLVDGGAVAGVDIGGSAPGTRETEMLNPTNMVMQTHAILLTGGSTYGLSAAGGVQRFLAEHDIGYRAATGVVVPIVPTACIFDLDVGKPKIYPESAMGYEACKVASADQTRIGSVGVGIGALVGKALGTSQAMRGGLGTSSTKLEGGVLVGALAVCNSWGDVIDPGDGCIVAGARSPDRAEFLDTDAWLTRQRFLDTRHFGMDTTLCVVATNAAFSREQITKIAMMAQDGIARATRPSHTMFDGDVVFALSCGREIEADVNVVGATAARLVWKSIVRGVLAANQIPPVIADDIA